MCCLISRCGVITVINFFYKHLFFIASVHYDTVVGCVWKTNWLSLSYWHCEETISVIMSQYWSGVGAVEAWWDICLLSPVFTAPVSIKLSMSPSCYCLWRFFFHCPVLETRFQPVFIKPHCKPIPGAIICSIILSHQQTDPSTMPFSVTQRKTNAIYCH